MALSAAGNNTEVSGERVYDKAALQSLTFWFPKVKHKGLQAAG